MHEARLLDFALRIDALLTSRNRVDWLTITPLLLQEIRYELGEDLGLAKDAACEESPTGVALPEAGLLELAEAVRDWQIASKLLSELDAMRASAGAWDKAATRCAEASDRVRNFDVDAALQRVWRTIEDKHD